MNRERKKVLFLCRENACRSQMAEGFLRFLAPESFEVYSAGSEPSRVHPYAIKVMDEVGIDISSQYSKSVSDFDGWTFDFVITVCAENACPAFMGKAGERISWFFEDPASVKGTEEEILSEFRRVRDKIGEKIKDFVKEYGQK